MHRRQFILVAVFTCPQRRIFLEWSGGMKDVGGQDRCPRFHNKNSMNTSIIGVDCRAIAGFIAPGCNRCCTFGDENLHLLCLKFKRRIAENVADE